MKHIQKTVKDFKFLYYQRHLIKGYFALPTPTIFAVKSPIGDGYVYLRQRINALQIRDFDNGFLRSVSHGNAPIGVRAVPVRGIPDGISMELALRDRDYTQTWVMTKDDLPRIVNEETYTEFLACIPIKTRDDPIVGKYQLISDYYERFIDVYRLVSGDAAVAHFESGLSFMPFTGEEIVEIEDHVTETFDEIVVNYYPKDFAHNVFQVDVHYTETGSVNAYHDEMERAERIGHFLATGLEVDPFHRRLADLIGVAQQARDHTLLVLSAFPVFETFYSAYLDEVRARAPEFDAFVHRKEQKANARFIQIGTRLEWLPTAISMLGFDASSVGGYYSAIMEANELRRATVHDGKQVGAEEAAQFIQKLTMCVNLCDTSLGRAEVFVSPLKLPDGTFAPKAKSNK
jgi:hypothetical protein